MKKTLSVVGCSMVLLLSACGQSPSTVANVPSNASLVITEGAAAPVALGTSAVLRTLSVASLSSRAGGSITSPVTVDGCASGTSSVIDAMYTVTGRQSQQATFQVNTLYVYDSATQAWTSSAPVMITVPVRAQGSGSTTFPVSITLRNSTSKSTGTSTVAVYTDYLETDGQGTLSLGNAATIGVSFNTSACPDVIVVTPPAPVNTAPSITMPGNFTTEATGVQTLVPFVVTAQDAQDAPSAIEIVCKIAGNDVSTPVSLALGEHVVVCTATDKGGLTAEGTFTITVEDTTAPVLSGVPTGGTVTAIDKNGYLVDVRGVTATDTVDPSPKVSCIPDTLQIAIGGSTTYTCTAKDASGNESDPKTFTVNVTLGNIGQTFQQPVNPNGNSAFKKGSTIPVKILPPTYVSGAGAVELADGLKLTVTRIGSTDSDTDSEPVDLSSGSTVWRYDALAGQYIFNLSTKSTWFTSAKYNAVVSYQGVVIAANAFNLK